MSDSLDVSTLSFETALEELEKIVRLLEEGRAPLDQTMAAYKKGAQLHLHCEKMLTQARLQIEEVMAKESGELTLTPSSLQEDTSAKP
jgi:exodeoxyribonuclease VII small subunit